MWLHSFAPCSFVVPVEIYVTFLQLSSCDFVSFPLLSWAALEHTVVPSSLMPSKHCFYYKKDSTTSSTTPPTARWLRSRMSRMKCDSANATWWKRKHLMKILPNSSQLFAGRNTFSLPWAKLQLLCFDGMSQRRGMSTARVPLMANSRLLHICSADHHLQL